MARIRTIKPQFWLNEELGTIPRDARLLYIGLWNLADDRGVFEWKPSRIKIQIFPYDSDIDNQNIIEWLGCLVQIHNIIQFSEDGEGYGFIPKFAKHQDIKKPSKWSYTRTVPSVEKLPMQSAYPTSTLPVPHQYPTSNSENTPPKIESNDTSITPPVGKELEVVGNREKEKVEVVVTTTALKNIFYSFKNNLKYNEIDFENEYEKFCEKYNDLELKDCQLLCHKWLDSALDYRLRHSNNGHKTHTAQTGGDATKFTRGKSANLLIRTPEDLVALKEFRGATNET
jgi:hypothetical protein